MVCYECGEPNKLLCNARLLINFAFPFTTAGFMPLFFSLLRGSVNPGASLTSSTWLYWGKKCPHTAKTATRNDYVRYNHQKERKINAHRRLL